MLGKIINWIRKRIRKLFGNDYTIIVSADFGPDESVALLMKVYDDGRVEMLKEITNKHQSSKNFEEKVTAMCKKRKLPLIKDTSHFRS